MNNNLETIRIFSEDVIPVYDTDTGEKVVLGRELHERLKIKTAYKDWFPRMCEYGFVDGKDYGSFLSNRSDGLAGKPRTDHIITLDMAKHIAMIQRTPEGMEIRQKLIDLEKNVSANQFAGLSKELQAILVIDQRTMKQEQRISALENTMTIDYNQQRVLKRVVNTVVINALGGMDSPAYKSRSVSQKLFMECNRDIQDWFNVNSRNNVPKKRFDEAVEYIKKWRPCANSVMLVQVTNGQTQMPM
jgi:phage anti-repressor protein|nr:MAG TPA: AntA/AntB antirepressor [Caudoviricetes sp.]